MALKEAVTEEVADARRSFDEACERLRPDLHRFCTRMTGSPCDGEDVLQEALVLAFYRLAELRDGASLRAWLFRIAHNKCIDFLRGRRRHERLDDADGGAREHTTEDRAMDDALDEKRRAEGVLTSVAADLPPKERACVVLKDMLDWSLEETAEITGSTVGAVKAALHRGREKLERGSERSAPAKQAMEPSRRALVERYLAAFDRRDWDGVRALLADEARLEIVTVAEGPIRDACYFVNYGRLSWPWRLALAWVDGVESIVHFRRVDGAWTPHSVVELGIAEGKITLVRDYVHVDYLLRDSVVTE